MQSFRRQSGTRGEKNYAEEVQKSKQTGLASVPAQTREEKDKTAMCLLLTKFRLSSKSVDIYFISLCSESFRLGLD